MKRSAGATQTDGNVIPTVSCIFQDYGELPTKRINTQQADRVPYYLVSDLILCAISHHLQKSFVPAILSYLVPKFVNGFLGIAVVNNLPANAGDTRDPGSIPG